MMLVKTKLSERSRKRVRVKSSLSLVEIISLILFCMISLSSSKQLLRNPSKMKESKEDPSTISSRSLQAGQPKPVMHTFYARIDPEKFHKYTGMSDEADSQLILAWKAAWEATGWETRILTLDDAKLHPDYDKFDKLLDLEKVPFGYYDKLCFMRWLAMAAVGGGWMSDYDTFPLRRVVFQDNVNEMPYGGRLTLYDRVKAGGVPSVVSGSRKEWDRLAHLILYNTLQRGVRKEFWSDMFALMDLWQLDNNVFEVKDMVLKGERAIEGSGTFDSVRSCNMMAGGNWAVHFSHNSITTAVARGHLTENESAQSRPVIAGNWLKEWASDCRQTQENTYIPPTDAPPEEKAET